MKRITALLLALTIALVAGGSAATSPPRLAAWLYATAEKLPHSKAPGETTEGYQKRLDAMTRSLANATKPYSDPAQGWTSTELALALMMLWHGETLFDERIHAGVKHPVWTEDSGKARCLGQLHISALVPKEEWDRLVGTDDGSTQLCADATARTWVAMARQCGVWSGQRANRMKVAQVFAAYGTGGNCKPQDRDFARADKWNAAIALRPDRAPVKGYRRAAPGEIPLPVKDAARNLVGWIGVERFEAVKPGAQFPVTEAPGYLVLIEKHAEGKVGASVLVKE